MTSILHFGDLLLLLETHCSLTKLNLHHVSAWPRRPIDFPLSPGQYSDLWCQKPGRDQATELPR